MELSYYESLAARAYRALDAPPTSLLAQQLPKAYVRSQITKNLKGLRACARVLSNGGAASGTANELIPVFAEGIEEAARLLSVTPEESREPATWLCIECKKTFKGNDREVSVHLEEGGCFDHWLWELRRESPLHRYEPTGREIHSSDGGGYYLSNHMKPEDVYFRLGGRFIKDAIEAAR